MQLQSRQENHLTARVFSIYFMLWAIVPRIQELFAYRTHTTNIVVESAISLKSKSFGADENSTDPPTIYHCHKGYGNGMGELKAVFSSIFPEYLIVDLSSHVSKHKSYNELNKRHTNANDIFLGLFYPIGCGEPLSQWLFLGFKGSIVVHSPESPHTHPDLNKLHKRIHCFGPVKENIKREGDLLLTYLQTVWWSEFQKDLSVSTLIYGKSQSKEHLNPFFMRHSSMGVF